MWNKLVQWHRNNADFIDGLVCGILTIGGTTSIHNGETVWGLFQLFFVVLSLWLRFGK